MFLWNVSKIFGHGIVSFALGVVRFCFSMLTVFAFLGVAVLLLKALVLHRPEAFGEAGLCLAVAFGAFVVNVAIATVQRRLRIALNRSIAGPQEPQEAPQGVGPVNRAPTSPAGLHGPLSASMRPANDEGFGVGWR